MDAIVAIKNDDGRWLVWDNEWEYEIDAQTWDPNAPKPEAMTEEDARRIAAECLADRYDEE